MSSLPIEFAFNSLRWTLDSLEITGHSVYHVMWLDGLILGLRGAEFWILSTDLVPLHLYLIPSFRVLASYSNTQTSQDGWNRYEHRSSGSGNLTRCIRHGPGTAPTAVLRDCGWIS